MPTIASLPGSRLHRECSIDHKSPMATSLDDKKTHAVFFPSVGAGLPYDFRAEQFEDIAGQTRSCDRSQFEFKRVRRNNGARQPYPLKKIVLH